MKGPLDLVSPARHAATAIERAAPAALSVAEIAASYRHPNAADLARVQAEYGLKNEDAAQQWLIAHVLATLEHSGKTARSRVQIVTENGGYRFADDVTFDDLRYNGKKLYRTFDEHKVLGDPFDPMSGAFSDNIRAVGNLDELRESMKEFGWIDDPIFYALTDERGVVLVGHRRLAVAEELGIEPRIRVVHCGSGDEADLKRLKLALLSNIAQRDMTPGERRKIVTVLAGPNHDWTQMSIAAALGVSQALISSDIKALKESGDLSAPDNSDKPKRGRPPKKKSEPREPHPRYHPALHEVINDLYDEEGKPTGKEIVKAWTEAGLVSPSGDPWSVHTAERALSIVDEKRKIETPPEPDPEPEPIPPHRHRYIQRFICECGEEKL